MKEIHFPHSSAAIPPLATEELSQRARIVAFKGGKIQPLLEGASCGAASPSRSLLVERIEHDQPADFSHTIVNDIVGLFLKPGHFRYRRGLQPMTDHSIHSGEAVICARNEHEILMWRSSLNVLCVQVDLSVLDETSRSLLRHGRGGLKPTLGISDPSLTTLLWAIEVEQRRGYPGGKLFVDSLESALAVRLVTDHSVHPATPGLARGGLAPHQQRRVLEFMHQNLHAPVGLADLAAVIGLSPSHFSSQFRAGMGMSPYKYMRALRIDRSKNMLKKSDFPIARIAKTVGFDNQQHFSTVFRSVVGVTPTTYRTHL